MTDMDLDTAERAGEQYVQDQLSSDYFRDWVHEQVVDAERMRQRDPASVLPLKSKSDARAVAKNMLQQLEWDTKRDLDTSVILELTGADRDDARAAAKAFYEGFGRELRTPTTRDWLADEILQAIERVRDRPHGGHHAVTREAGAPTEQQLVDYFVFDAEDVDVGTFSRAKTDEVAAHFGMSQVAAFRALDALAKKGVLQKTRDIMKGRHGKKAVGFQWWEYVWQPGDLERYEARSDSGAVRETARASQPMSANGFIELLKSLEPADRRTNVRFQKSLGGERGGGSVYVNFVNLPVGKGESGAESENNRASFWIEGFGYDPSIPVATVKAEQSTNVFHRGSLGSPSVPFRAKSGAPDAVSRYLAAYLAKVVEAVPPNFTHTAVGEASAAAQYRRHHRPTGPVSEVPPRRRRR